MINKGDTFKVHGLSRQDEAISIFKNGGTYIATKVLGIGDMAEVYVDDNWIDISKCTKILK